MTSAINCTMTVRRTGEELEVPPAVSPLEIDQPVRELRLSNLNKLFWKTEAIRSSSISATRSTA